MQDHIEHIVPLRRTTNHKMSLHDLHSPLHPYELSRRYTAQYRLEVRYVLGLNLHREGLPVEHVAEGQHVVVGDYDGHALEVDCFHDSRASHLVPTRAEAVLALPHHVVVRYSLREVLMDLNLFIFALPPVQEERPDVAVEAPCEEGEERAVRG